jgi:very-short-patch-repair endonuclease
LQYNNSELKLRRRALRNNLTKAEIILWGLVRKRQINNVKVRIQFSIDNYIIDFFSPELMLAIEVDGDTHFEESDVKKDVMRQRHLEKFGITFLRFTNNDIFDSPDAVIERIRDTVVLLNNAL